MFMPTPLVAQVVEPGCTVDLADEMFYDIFPRYKYDDIEIISRMYMGDCTYQYRFILDFEDYMEEIFIYL